MQNFDKQWYLDNYKDVVLSGMDPFVHYQKIGRLLNRHPCDPTKIKVSPQFRLSNRSLQIL